MLSLHKYFLAAIVTLGLTACHNTGSSESKPTSSSAAADSDASSKASMSSSSPSSAADREEYPAPADAQLNNFIELARRDIQLHKAALIADNMPFTNDEATEFWPIYREYEADLYKINSRKLELIRRFLPDSQQLSDEQAKSLAKEAFEIEDQRTALKRKYFTKFQQALPATKTARFFQIENQLNMIADLRIAAAMPLIK